MLKSLNPPPTPFYPPALDLGAQARAARGNLYPMTFFYGLLAFLVVGFVLWAPQTRLTGLLFFGAGLVLWTPVEYIAHRFVLHPPFPDGKGLIDHGLHKLFDNLHWEHHQRPWDGNHLSGSLSQTLPFFVILALASLLSPLATGPVMLAGLALGYVTEEWLHYAAHFERLPGAYCAYMRRYHLRHHHSPGAHEYGFGISSPFWDLVVGTSFPEPKPHPEATTKP